MTTPAEYSPSTRLTLRRPALMWAVALGLLADALLRTPGRPGLNAALCALVGAAVVIMLLRRRCDPPARESVWMVGAAFVLVAALTLRDSESLAVFSVFGAMVLLGMAAGRAATAWAANALPSDVAFSAIRVGLLGAAGPLGWGRGDPDAVPTSTGVSRGGRTLLRGTLMALPPLLFLGALLMSADEVFARIIRDTFQIDFEMVVQHVALTAVIAWGSAGYLRALLVPDDDIMSQLRVPRPGLPAAEISVALWILNLLFLAFMAVQLRYLFGGATLVEVTPGLTYADYARKGFFELVAAATLVVPILVAADWAAAQENERSRTVLRGTAVVLVVLLVGVIASAAYRMWLYQQAYGLTEDRVYGSVFIAWLTVSLGWLVYTVLRGRRERFALGTIVAGLAAIASLYVLNPDALIARVNVDRMAAGKVFDGEYVAALSGDAVPVLVSRLDRLPEVERCKAIRMLKERWTGERRGGWRTWNLSDARARRVVAPLTIPATCPPPPPPATAPASSSAPVAPGNR
jgi:hypothetical protein